jgi:hypothetical protein
MSKSLKEMNLTELYKEAQKLNIKGRTSLKGSKNRDKMITAIIEARKKKVVEGEEELKTDVEGRTERDIAREDRILEEAIKELQDEDEVPSVKELSANERISKITRETAPPPAELVRSLEGKQPPLQIIKDVLSSDDSRRLLQQFSQSDLQKIKKIYNDASKDVQKYGVRNGLIRFGMKAGAPELALLQQASDFLGTTYSNKDHEDLMRVIRGEKSGRSGAEDFKLGMKLVVNPVEWARLAGEEAFAVGENAISGISDVVRKVRGLKKDVRDPEADVARGVVKQRTDALKKKIAQEKKLAEIKGEKYSGLSEDDIVEDKLKMPKLSDFGGKDEKSALETLGETIAETALFVPKRAFGDEDEVMKERFRKSDPAGYKRYEEAMRRYQNKKDRILETRGENIKGDAKRLRSDLASVIDSILDEEKRNLQSGGKQRINDLDLEELHDISLTLRDNETAITYDNLAELYAGIKVNVPKNILSSSDVKNKMGAFDYLENTMLKPKTDTEADLRVSTNDKFKNTLEMKDRLDKKQKQIEDAIEEKRIDDERLEVIQSRADNITHGYVDTDNKGRPEYKMRVFYGNTDAQLMTTAAEKRRATLLHDTALMWPQLNTEDNSRANTLWQKQQAWEKQRYSKTFQPPNPRDLLGLDKDKKQRNGLNHESKRKDKFNYRIPESFIRIGQRELIPVYPMTNVPDLRVPEQAQAPFNTPEPQNDFGSIKREERVMPNRFPERFLKNYNGPVIKPKRKPLTYEEKLRWIS